MYENIALNIIKDILGKDAEIVSTISGGMMNVSFLIKNKDKEYILYIPGQSSEGLVDRVLEQENQKIVYDLGVTSKNIYFDVKTGIKMNEFIPGQSINNIPDNEIDINKIAKLFHVVHSSKQLSNRDYPLFNLLDEYEKALLNFIPKLDEDYLKLRKYINDNKIEMLTFKKALCHNDSQKSNIIKDLHGNYRIIDFEFMMNNDPLYDIAAYGNGKVEEGRKLLDAYFNNNPSKDNIIRFYRWRIYISLQWYLLAIIKHYKKDGEVMNIDFLSVANHFLNNAKEAYKSI